MINKILHSVKIFIIRYSILNCLLFLFACDFTMIKELDIEPLDFPPKLSVHAILGGDGIFDIRLMESVSLAEYNRKIIKEIIRSGEIRLYLDGNLIRTIPGPFEISPKTTENGVLKGYRMTLFGIIISPGSVYRLEVDVEGYPSVVSTSTMPVAPVASASMDTSVQVIRKNVKEVGTAGYWLSLLGNWQKTYPERYWPLSIGINVPADANNYYAIDIRKYERSGSQNIVYTWGIGGSDAAILLEEGMESELMSSDRIDLYLFSLLTTKNFAKDALRNFYAAVDESINNPEIDNTELAENPDYEKITTQHSLILRVRNISPDTYRYYRSISLQFWNAGVFHEQPSVVVGNIKGGYGCFSVYNTTNITLLEWETYEYREKNE